MILRPALFAAALLTSPVAAGAEGARLVFHCTDSEGATVQVTVAPDNVDAQGAGQVTMAYAETTAPGYAASTNGPFIWSGATDRFAFLLDGVNNDGHLRALLHRLPIESPVMGQLTSLTCENHF